MSHDHSYDNGEAVQAHDEEREGSPTSEGAPPTMLEEEGGAEFGPMTEDEEAELIEKWSKIVGPNYSVKVRDIIILVMTSLHSYSDRLHHHYITTRWRK